MARRTAQQPITYSATFAPAPMTADGVLRMQRYCARSMAQTILACPELLEMGETAAGLLVPTTSGMADFALFGDLFTKSTPLDAKAQDSPQPGRLLTCDATTRQEGTFRFMHGRASVWTWRRAAHRCSNCVISARSRISPVVGNRTGALQHGQPCCRRPY